MKEVETLDGASREAFAAWLGQAHARLSADETLSTLESTLLVSVGGDAKSRSNRPDDPHPRSSLLGVVAAAVGLAWFADRPGTVTIEWLGYQIETSALVGALAIAALVALLILLWAVLRYLFTRPAAIAAHLRERRRQQGYDALSRGLLAIGVGDRTLAQRYAGIAGRNLPNEPLTALLRAQAAQLKGDRDAARRAFEAMLDHPETRAAWACADCSSKRGAATTPRRRAPSPSRR